MKFMNYTTPFHLVPSVHVLCPAVLVFPLRALDPRIQGGL